MIAVCALSPVLLNGLPNLDLFFLFALPKAGNKLKTGSRVFTSPQPKRGINGPRTAGLLY